jgi:Zn-dependent protease
VLIAEPPPTRYDIHFRLAGFPVRIHPFFWVTGVLLGLSGERRLTDVLIFVVAMFISILVHELGHALLIRRYGWGSHIILYWLGGLATFDSPESYLPTVNENESSPRAKIQIAAAGPGAGFLLAGLIAGVLSLCPVDFRFRFDRQSGIAWSYNLGPRLSLAEYQAELASGGVVPGTRQFDKQVRRYEQSLAARGRLAVFLHDMLFINIFWGLMNLLPVYPLDGGQIARELLSLNNPRAGVEKSLLLSAIVGGIVACLSLYHFGVGHHEWRNGLFMVLLFGSLAFISYRGLQQLRSQGGYGYGGFEHDDDDWWRR